MILDVSLALEQHGLMRLDLGQKLGQAAGIDRRPDMAVLVLCSQLCAGQRDFPFGMPMQLPVIGRGDALDPMVVNVGIDVADVKGFLLVVVHFPQKSRIYAWILSVLNSQKQH